MLDAILAELLKLRRHRATWLLVWIYPILMTLIAVIGIINDHGGLGGDQPNAALWMKQSALLWIVPASSGGRFLIAAFAAVAFAGEYGWNTWKLVIPARARWQLVIAKWIAVTALVLAGALAADLIVVLGSVIPPLIGGPQVPAGVTMGGMAAVHVNALGRAIVPIFYAVAGAGLFAVATRSVLGTFVLSLLVIIVELLLPGFAPLLSSGAAGMTRLLIELFPFYHVGNLVGIIESLPPRVIPLVGGAYVASWSTSITITVTWIAAACVATLLLFQRQDQN